MKIKTADLTGAALDYAVASKLGDEVEIPEETHHENYV
jgi:hypothetical protein